MRKKASVSSQSPAPRSGSAHRSSGSGPAVPSVSTPALGGGGLLVVVELGSEWPSQAAATPSGPAPSMRRVLAQAEGETPAAFSERVTSSLEGLFGRGIQLETVVLACNERLDEAAEASRRRTVDLALGSMAKHKSGRAYLAAPGRSGGRLRHALSALARGLFDEWRTAGLEVSVDFGQEDGAATGPLPFPLTARVA